MEKRRIEGMSRHDSTHDIKASRDHLVITDLPFVIEPETFAGTPRKRKAQDFTRLWIVRKEDLRNTQPAAASRA